ncbi:MAG: hypothetical protein MHMPM18_000165 [Marteilia pararefringens]
MAPPAASSSSMMNKLWRAKQAFYFVTSDGTGFGLLSRVLISALPLTVIVCEMKFVNYLLAKNKEMK